MDVQVGPPSTPVNSVVSKVNTSIYNHHLIQGGVPQDLFRMKLMENNLPLSSWKCSVPVLLLSLQGLSEERKRQKDSSSNKKISKPLEFCTLIKWLI